MDYCCLCVSCFDGEVKWCVLSRVSMLLCCDVLYFGCEELECIALYVGVKWPIVIYCVVCQ